MSKSLVFSVVLGTFVLSGCSTTENMARFTFASTANITTIKTNEGEFIEGKECLSVIPILGITTGSTTNRISGAVAKALEDGRKKGIPADALVDVDISHTHTFTEDCVVAKGRVVGIRK